MELGASSATFFLLALLLATNQGNRHPEYEEIYTQAAADRSPAQVFSYDRYQLWKIHVNDAKSKKVTEKLENQGLLTTWRVNSSSIDVLVHVDQDKKIKDELAQNQLKYDVSIKNLQPVIAQTATKEEHLSADDKRKHLMDWKVFHRLSTIYGYMYAMSQMHPDICTLQTIGETAENRQILMLRINKGSVRRKRVWLDGGMHAREWISPAAVTYVIEQIVQQYAHNRSHPVKNIDWYIVPVLNPDGYEYSHTANRLWRKNRSRVKVGGPENRCYGVDLNRNFGYQWTLELGTSRDPCSGMYRGPAPFSEAETAAVARFFINHPDENNTWRGFISVHSYGQQIVYPWASRDLSGDQMEDELHATAVKAAQNELQEITVTLNQTKAALSSKSLCSPELNVEFERTLEELKDSQEINTALQLQLDTVNKSHCLLKNHYDDLCTAHKSLERRLAELDATVHKYRNELVNAQTHKDKLLENEANLNRLLDVEKLHAKNLKVQNEKDARCIQDLNRQIKEMERIIARKHPDSVSALIVAAKNDAAESNLTARKILENRIKTLEEEASNRDTQSSRVFLDIQDKFNQMKLKYESHIEDLELHVKDLKSQLKRKIDTFDMYTQTVHERHRHEKIPQKDSANVWTQTDAKMQKRNEKLAEAKEDTHLIATIRGLQVDLTNKEKVVAKLQREIDDLRKTNRKLQKEREGSLRSLNVSRSEFRSYPEKLVQATAVKTPSQDDDEIKFLKSERDKMKQQLCRMEEDYQALKSKRLHDLNALQEAHEREIATYVSNVTPLREQLELQQVSLSTLQGQLSNTKEELLIATVERDHLNNQLLLCQQRHQTMSNQQQGDNKRSFTIRSASSENDGDDIVESLQKKIGFLEKRYEEREFRLRAIVHGLAQKNVTNRSCEQCAERQRQLIGYKTELDQLLATLRALK